MNQLSEERIERKKQLIAKLDLAVLLARRIHEQVIEWGVIMEANRAGQKVTKS